MVGFEIQITDIQAKQKLSQNRDDKNHAAIVEKLELSEDGQSKEIAQLMKDCRESLVDSGRRSVSESIVASRES